MKDKIFKWIIVTFLVLSVPLIAMQFTDELNWQMTDFIIMGTAIFGGGVSFELVKATSKNRIIQVAFGLTLFCMFLLFWVNGGVGIIGNEDQDANLLFGLVPLVCLCGTLMVRFRPKGMALVLFVTAATQMLVPAIAYMIWPPPGTSWSPGVITVFIICSVFAFLFLLSGMLFRQAAYTSQQNM